MSILSPHAACVKQKPILCKHMSRRYLCLLLLLSLEVLVGEVGCGTTDEHNGVHTDTEAGGIARRCRGGNGAGLG